MAPRFSLAAFDVNGTLSDLAPMEQHFSAVGAPAHLAPLWFASLLRDGFALTAAGVPADFARIGEVLLRGMLPGQPLNRDLDGAVAHILDGFRSLDVHPDVPEGVRALRAAGLRLVTLSNGAPSIADALLERAGVRGEFERVASAAEGTVWKPARLAYEHGSGLFGVPAAEMLLVAVHPWDIDGAARAGLGTCWINRSGGAYPEFFTPPTYTVSALPELAKALQG